VRKKQNRGSVEENSRRHRSGDGNGNDDSRRIGRAQAVPLPRTVFNASVAAPDYDKAYKLGTAMLTKRTISVGSTMSRLGFLQLIQKVIDHAAMGCWECSKREAE
jgi:hypothetical protein